MKNLLYISIWVSLVIFSCDKEDISPDQADSFVKFYTNFPEFFAADIDKTGDTGYALLGTAKTSFRGTDMCLLRTDEYGNTVDTARLYGRLLDEKAFCLRTLSDGGFAILGSSQNPVTQKSEVLFIRTNSIGDTLWTRTMRVNGNVEARSFEIDAQGTFYLTGYRDDILVKGKDVWLFAINSDGTYPWPTARSHGGARDDEGTHMELLSNGYLAITGKTKSSTYGITYNQSFILITNDKGLQDDWIDIKSENNEEEAVNIINIDGSNCLLLTTSKNTTGSSIVLYKVNIGTRSVEWKRTYEGFGKDIARSLLVTNNSFYILGNTGTGTTTNSAISIIHTDDSGNQVNRVDFGKGSQLSGSAFQNTEDGGFVLLGTNENPQENNTSVALIKLKAELSF
jgi:hypothetical protein